MNQIPPPVTRCNRCGDPIRWVVTRSGKKMPVDANKIPRGNVELVDGVAEVVLPDATERYVAHFATCHPK